MTTTTTTTTTTNNPQFLVLRLTQFPEMKASYQDQIEKLEKIVDKYSNWGDFLSLRIHRWAAKIILVNLDDPVTVQESNVNEELLRAFAAKKIYKLLNKILVNTHERKKPMGERPMLDGDFTWDHTVLEAYKQVWSAPEVQALVKSQRASPAPDPLRPESPFDSCFINAVPHDFAIEITAFAREFLATNVPSAGSSSSIVLQSIPENAITMPLTGSSRDLAYKKVVTRWATDLVLAGQCQGMAYTKFLEIFSNSRDAKTFEETYWKRKNNNEAAREWEKKDKEAKALAAEERRQARREQEQAVADIAASIDRSESNQRVVVDTLSERVERVEGTNTALNARLEERDQTVLGLHRRLNTLEGNIQQKEREIQDIRNQKNKKSCSVM